MNAALDRLAGETACALIVERSDPLAGRVRAAEHLNDGALRVCITSPQRSDAGIACMESSPAVLEREHVA